MLRVGLRLNGWEPKKETHLNLGLSPLPVRVTTRIITFLVGNPYKPSFPLLLGGGTTQSKPKLHFVVQNVSFSGCTPSLISPEI